MTVSSISAISNHATQQSQPSSSVSNASPSTHVVSTDPVVLERQEKMLKEQITQSTQANGSTQHILILNQKLQEIQRQMHRVNGVAQPELPEVGPAQNPPVVDAEV